MGQFRVTVVAVGNHGCGRSADELGSAVWTKMEPCQRPTCTDCITRLYVEQLQAAGAAVSEATIHHWPGTKGEVVDNVLTNLRIGSFRGTPPA